MNLYEKVGRTEPGKHAHLIGDLLYYRSEKIGEAYANKLTDIRAYLERLAFEEIKRTEGQWMGEYVEKTKGGKQ